MPSLPQPIVEMSAALGQLPGIGPRSAERLALHLAQTDQGAVRVLGETLARCREAVVICETCGALAEKQPCSICDDAQRDGSLICLVEGATDILSLEKAGTFRGRYHVLGGRISPLDGVEPEDLRISELEDRIGKEGVKEIVLALSSDVEGDATSHYLAKRLGEKGVEVTRVAHGLPAGSGLEFADELTLSRALEGRRPIE